jgi:uncharacterized protein YqhQ
VSDTPIKASEAAKKEYLQYGGQAIIEGVMMRSPRYFAIACRAPNGEIVLTTEALEKTWIGRQKWLRWPFFRGSLALIDTMALAIKSMRFAANVQTDPKFAKEEDKAVGKVEAAPSKKVQDATIGATMFVSLGMGVLLFNYLPNLIAQPLEGHGASGTMINFVTEIVKIVIFLGYLYLIGQLPDIKEVFKYHGAEHKAINAMEADQPLTLDSVQAQTRLHPRCGTSFAISVLIVSMLVFTFIPRYPFGKPQGYLIDASVRFGVELLLLPLISGIAYELIRAAGRMRNSAIFGTLIYPGLMSQYLTTREPEERHVEISMISLQAVIEAEERGALAQSVEELMRDPRQKIAVTEIPVPL